ncbi:MAG: CRISPR-associated protein Cas2 [Chloroflexi bacterium]|nr:CRISPR-associated protein Cas2 [Chloroflexota bacterium]
MRYLISYDLRAPNRDYERLYSALDGIGAKRVLESAWAVQVTNMGAAGIRDWVRQYTDDDDGVLVSPLQTDWAAWRAQVNINDV